MFVAINWLNLMGLLVRKRRRLLRMVSASIVASSYPVLRAHRVVVLHALAASLTFVERQAESATDASRA